MEDFATNRQLTGLSGYGRLVLNGQTMGSVMESSQPQRVVIELHLEPELWNVWNISDWAALRGRFFPYSAK